MTVILISAAPGNEEYQKYMNSGINGFLQKPFTEEMLASVITEVLPDAVSIFREPAGSAGIETVREGEPDLRNLYHISGGDNQFVRQMLVSFIETTGKGLSEMQEAIKNLQWETAADLSHKIQPPCRHIGALRLYNILNTIEKAIRKNDYTESVDKMAENALLEFGVISRQINDHITKME
jgi:HPt (histidine-containing phosphotransfer) domain-containing protein